MSINVKILEFKESIINVVNKSELPITVKQMALNEIINQVNVVAMQTIEAERLAAQKEGVKDGKEIHKD